MKESKIKMGKEIRIIKKDNHKKFEDYTFIDNNNIELKKIIDNENDSNSSSSSNDKSTKSMFSSLETIQRRIGRHTRRGQG